MFVLGCAGGVLRPFELSASDIGTYIDCPIAAIHSHTGVTAIVRSRDLRGSTADLIWPATIWLRVEGLEGLLEHLTVMPLALHR